MANKNDKTTKTNPDADTLIRRRKERSANRGGTATADWESVDSTLLGKLIAGFTAIGGVISLGYTKDGGAYYINYYIKGESFKEYIRPTEDVDSRLLDEIDSWDLSH